jgi:2-C-methyl-D-erythritol 2,4-cyclodiphosphate synthase
MQKVIAAICGIQPGDVSIKATTSEKLGYVGREEGVFAQAVVLLFGID